jgi:hypothetical protein
VQGTDWPVEISKGTADITEEEYGDALTLVSTGFAPTGAPVTIGKSAPTNDALLTWYRMRFELPEKTAGLSAPWHLHLEAKGNGFIYVNRHCLGRYWQAGPQHDFFIPDNWLNFGPARGGLPPPNAIVLDLRPVDKGVGLTAVSVVPDASFAVETAGVGQ